MTERFFAPGSVIVKRGLLPKVLQVGEVCDVKPVTVVRDDDQLIALWAPIGMPTMASRPRDPNLPRPWLADQCELVHDVWRWRNALLLYLPGQRWSTWVTWSVEWDFLGWYINLQSLLCRTAIGFDERDHRLDVVVAPDRSWQWKDQHEFSRSIEIGEYTTEEVEAIRRTGREAIRHLEANQPPFCDPWDQWRPPPDWVTPATLPEWRAAC